MHDDSRCAYFSAKIISLSFIQSLFYSFIHLLSVEKKKKLV